jgi:hypothetical protein
MWTSLLNFLGLVEPKHCTAVRTALRQREPTFEILGTNLLRHEADNWIVAIFFREPNVQVKPPRYKVFSVSDDMSRIDELPCGPNSRYWIRGRN